MQLKPLENVSCLKLLRSVISRQVIVEQNCVLKSTARLMLKHHKSVVIQVILFGEE
jgi:hypothetical protein